MGEAIQQFRKARPEQLERDHFPQPFSDGTGARGELATTSGPRNADNGTPGPTAGHDTASARFGHGSLRNELEGETMNGTRGRLVVTAG